MGLGLGLELGLGLGLVLGSGLGSGLGFGLGLGLGLWLGLGLVREGTAEARARHDRVVVGIEQEQGGGNQREPLVARGGRVVVVHAGVAVLPPRQGLVRGSGWLSRGG